MAEVAVSVLRVVLVNGLLLAALVAGSVLLYRSLAARRDAIDGMTKLHQEWRSLAAAQRAQTEAATTPTTGARSASRRRQSRLSVVANQQEES